MRELDAEAVQLVRDARQTEAGDNHHHGCRQLVGAIGGLTELHLGPLGGSRGTCP